MSLEPIIPARLRALANLLANDAAKDPDVQHFRTEVLDGQLLEPVAVESWIRSRVATEPPHPTPPADPTEWKRAAAAGELPDPAPMLYFQAPADLKAAGFERNVTIGKTGVLFRLQQLSEYLSARFGWQKGQATGFLLAGAVPQLPAEPAVKIVPRYPYGALSRVILECDPMASVGEVTAAFKKARRRLLGSRYRPPTEKMNALAEYTADLFIAGSLEKRAGTPTWEKIMRQWNVLCDDKSHDGRVYSSDWAGYTHGSSFGHTATKRARAKVLGYHATVDWIKDGKKRQKPRTNGVP